MEIISIKQIHGLAKVLGSILCLSGAMMFAFVKGPPVDFMKWYPANQKQISHSLTSDHSKENCIRGPLMMLSANASWALWLVLQVYISLLSPSQPNSLHFLLLF